MVDVTTNLLPNPSAELGASHVRCVGGTVSSVVGDAQVGARYFQATATQANPEFYFTAGGSNGIPNRFPVTAGQQHTFSVYARASKAGVPQTLYIYYYDAAGASLGFHNAGQAVLLQGVWSRRAAIFPAALAGAAWAEVASYSPGGLVSGDTLHFDAAMVTQGTTLHDYFDGDTPDGALNTYSWTGTPGASTSTRTIREITTSEPRSNAAPSRQTSRRGWRYFATRLNGNGTETLLDPDLPLEDVTIEDVLSGDQAMDCQIDPAYSRLIGADDLPILREWGTAIYAENDGDIRFGGILTSSDIQGPRWSLETVGFTGYSREMPYTGSGYKGVRVDPIAVMRTIWAHMQGQPGGNLGLTLDGTTTGGKVSIGTELKQVEFDTQSGPVSFESGPYKLNWYTNHDLASDIDDLAAFAPFDYHERHFWDGQTIRHHIDIGYPKIGRRRTDVRFVFGVNVFEVPQIDRDGSLYASGTMVLGAGEGASMIKSIRETPTRPHGRLRRIAIVQDDTIKSIARANTRADTENQWRARMDDISSVVVKDHSSARLGSVKVGDEIRLEGRGDWQDYDMWVRVLAISYQPANGNLAEYTVARTDKLTS